MSVLVDREWIKQHAYRNDKDAVAINSSQCIIIGLDFKIDLTKGWLDLFEPVTISNASAELFIRLKGANKRKQQQIIQEFKLELNKSDFELGGYEFNIKNCASPELWRGNDFLGHFKTVEDAKKYAQEYVLGLDKLKSLYNKAAD